MKEDDYILCSNKDRSCRILQLHTNEHIGRCSLSPYDEPSDRKLLAGLLKQLSDIQLVLGWGEKGMKWDLMLMVHLLKQLDEAKLS